MTGGLWGALGERLRDGLMGPVGMATPGLQNSTLDPAGVGVGGVPLGNPCFGRIRATCLQRLWSHLFLGAWPCACHSRGVLAVLWTLSCHLQA